MANEQVIEMAKKARFHSALLLHIYDGKKEALCDSELKELDSIEMFANMIRKSVLEECIEICDEVQRQYGQFTFTARIVKETLEEKIANENHEF